MTDYTYPDAPGGHKTALDGDEAIGAVSDPGGTPTDVYITPADMGFVKVNASTITTGNLACSEGNQYDCTIGGLTANRNAVLPAPSAAGRYIRLNIVDGDDTYALIIIGDTGVTINGGSAATEWSRIRTKGESVTLESTSTTNWNVVIDRRIRCLGVAERQAAQNIASQASPDTKVLLDTSIINVGGMVDVVTNNRINIWRPGNYKIVGHTTIEGLDSTERIITLIYVDGSAVNFTASYLSASASVSSAQMSIYKTLTAGQYVGLWMNHNEGAAQNTSTSFPPFLVVEEILS